MNREPTPTRRPVQDTLFAGRLGDAFLLDLEVVDVQAIAPRIRSIGVASTDLVRLLGGPAAEKDRTAAKAYWRRDQANMSHGEPMRD